MSIYAFHLQGWEELSTWGHDDDVYYAQLTRNGASDIDGPQVGLPHLGTSSGASLTWCTP